MTKRQIIDEILTINTNADPGFLAGFDPSDLDDYLRRIQTTLEPRAVGRRRPVREIFPGLSARPSRRSFLGGAGYG